MTDGAPASSTYLDLLPAIYNSDFLGSFLLAFEQVLTGAAPTDAATPHGLEQTITSIAQLFDPLQQQEFCRHLQARDNRPDDFLTWLSGWVSLSLRADLTDLEKRRFLAHVVQLYRRRGTKDNLAELLRIYTTFLPTIDGPDQPPAQIKPHHFFVNIHIDPDRALLQKTEDIARALIDLQKPAHTTYDLKFTFRTMQISSTAPKLQIGVNTLLGTSTTDERK